MRRAIALVVTAVLLVGCSGGAGDSVTSFTQAPSASAAPVDEPGVISGKFNVGDEHALYLECRGSGSPTVVYLHGYIGDEFSGGRENWASIPDELEDDYRVCTYDRTNVGLSDDLPSVRTGADSVRELKALLSEAQVPGPYVLLGGSFGGVIAYMYAVEHPDDVIGMVLLDPALPGDYRLADLIPEGAVDIFPDWNDTVERIDDPATTRLAERLEGQAPSIPVTLLAARPEFDPSWPAEEMAALVHDLQQRLVDQFSPGRIVSVDTPHYMEPVIPEQIAAEVRTVIEAAE